MKNKFLLVGIFLIPFIPFVVVDSFFFPFITGKAFVFRILVELLFGSWLVLAFWDKKYRPDFSCIFVLAGLFVAIIGLADISGSNPLKSIWSNFERMEGWITLVHLFAYLLVVGTVLNTEKLWERFFNIFVLTGVGMSGYGFLQLVGKAQIHQGGVRLDATFGNSAYLAVYLLLNIFIAFLLLLRRKNFDLVGWFYSLAIFFQVVILYNTATRGALLGLIVGIFTTSILIFFREKENLLLKKISGGIFIGLVVLVALFVSVKETSFVQKSPVLNRFAEISLSETTTKSRFAVWNMAFEGFKEKPLLGWGQENFNYVFNKNYDPKIHNQESWFDRTHNVFFDWLIAGGLIGLLSYLSLFAVIIYYLFFKKEIIFSVTDQAVISGMLMGYFTHNFFVFDNLVSYIMFFSLLGYIHFRVKKETTKNDINKNIFYLLAPVIVVLFFACLYFVNIRGILTSRNLIFALTPQKEGFVKNLEYFDKAIGGGFLGRQEAVEQLSQFASSGASAKINQNAKTEMFSFAFDKMEQAIKSDPENARLHFIQGVFLANAGDYEKALIRLNKASELSPNKPAILTVIGSLLSSQGKQEDAIVYFKKAFDLAPEFKDLMNNYAAALIRIGKSGEANDLLSGSSDVNDAVIQAYYSVKNFDQLIKILEAREKKNQSDFQNKLSLASVYFEAGYKNKAIEKIQEVIKLKPDFKEQGEYYINQIKTGKKP